MKAGQTDLEVGTRVQITGITNKDDIELNGLTGTITHPFGFGCTKKGWVGVYLDTHATSYGDKCNIKETELKIIEE